MPLYKYRCDECDNTFKVLKKNGKKDEDPECPECGSADTERMISSVGIRFKGSGFYRTDYGGNGNHKGNGGSGKVNENDGNNGSGEKETKGAKESSKKEEN